MPASITASDSTSPSSPSPSISSISDLTWASSLSLYMNSLPMLTLAQKQVFPLVFMNKNVRCKDEETMNGVDVFVLPCVNKLLLSPLSDALVEGTKAFPQLLYLVSTREHALQVFAFIGNVIQNTSLKACYLVGGSSREEQQATVRKGAHILIATPGRLADFMMNDIVSLAGVRTLVVGGMDKMIDMGFEDTFWLLVDACSHVHPQTLVTSHNDSETMRVKYSRLLGDSHAYVMDVTAVERKRLKHDVRFVSEVAKQDELLRVLQTEAEEGKSTHVRDGKTVVYVLKKSAVDSLENWLASKGVSVVGVHGDREPGEVAGALSKFRSGEASVLIATIVVSRGADLGAVERVINFDCPTDIEDYLFRARRQQLSVIMSFLTCDDAALLPALRQVLEYNGQVVTDWPSS